MSCSKAYACAWTEVEPADCPGKFHFVFIRVSTGFRAGPRIVILFLRQESDSLGKGMKKTDSAKSSEERGSVRRFSGGNVAPSSFRRKPESRGKHFPYVARRSAEAFSSSPHLPTGSRHRKFRDPSQRTEP